MRIFRYSQLIFVFALAFVASGSLQLCAQNQLLDQKQSTYTKTETTTNSNSTVSTNSSSSSTTTSGGAAGMGSIGGTNSTTSTTLRTEKPSIAITPTFKRRLSNIGEQIDLAAGKGFVGSDEASAFKQRLSQIVAVDQDASKKGMPQASVVEIERAITVLNADIYKAMHKDTAAKDPDTTAKDAPAKKEIPETGSP